ncbi:MAG: hypothetical protein COA57_06000 [Flavobacteriales bacterium]|nr:MAG: hypothetical protein COA57_06000 [Flavobacteriales bacterium]
MRKSIDKIATTTFLITTLLLGLGNGSFSQDIHFSQFNMAPLAINPALAGAFNGDQRVILNYRDQWKSIGAPYKTFALSADARMLGKKLNNGALGVGLFIFNDKSGDLQMGLTQATIALSGLIKLNEHNNVSAGLQGGYAQRTINTDKMIWDSQFDGTSYNSNLPTGEKDNFDSFGFADLSTGLAWSYSSNASTISSKDEFRARAGIALFHVNRPKQKFLGSTMDKLHSKYTAHASLYIGTGTVLSLIPSVIYYRQGTLQETNLGMLFRYTITEESRFTNIIKETAVSIGGHYRFGDAIIPKLLIEYASYAIGISYDINLSPLKAATNAKGGIEISIKYVNPNPFKGRSTKSNVKFM